MAESSKVNKSLNTVTVSIATCQFTSNHEAMVFEGIVCVHVVYFCKAVYYVSFPWMKPAQLLAIRISSHCTTLHYACAETSSLKKTYSCQITVANQALELFRLEYLAIDNMRHCSLGLCLKTM